MDLGKNTMEQFLKHITFPRVPKKNQTYIRPEAGCICTAVIPALRNDVTNPYATKTP